MILPCFKEHVPHGHRSKRSAESTSELLPSLAARSRALWVFRKDAQDGRGSKRSAESTSELFPSLAARSRALCAPRRRSGQNGSAMVEGALVLALFILIVYGFVQIALVLFGYTNLTYASRVAMRYAVMHGSTATYTCTAADIQNMITPLLWGAPASGTTVTTNWNPNNSPGSAVSISVTVKYNSVIPFTSLKVFTIGSTAYGVMIQ